MKENLVSFENTDESYGGKASGLGLLQKKGFKVPKGYALSPDYVESISGNEKSNLVALSDALQTFPKDAKFAFDQASREIVWDIGDLVGESSESASGKEIFFQVILTPDSGQIGQAAQLVSEAKIIGDDSWTETSLENKVPAITTNLPDDPSVAGKDIVQ